MRVCKRLQIDYAEAVVGFEFGNRMAVPVIQGVVIAQENYEMALEQLEKDEAERVRKEDEKRRKAALAQWRRFLMGMRIAERIRQEYGGIDEEVSVFGHARDAPKTSKLPEASDDDMAGGFLPEGYMDAEEEVEEPTHQTSSFFPVVDEDDDADDGLLMEEEAETKLANGIDGPSLEKPAEPEQQEVGDQAGFDIKRDLESSIESDAGSGAESDIPLPAQRSRRKRQSKPVEAERPATRRSTRIGRNTISYDEDDVGAEAEEMENGYIDSDGGELA